MGEGEMEEDQSQQGRVLVWALISGKVKCMLEIEGRSLLYWEKAGHILSLITPGGHAAWDRPVGPTLGLDLCRFLSMVTNGSVSRQRIELC